VRAGWEFLIKKHVDTVALGQMKNQLYVPKAKNHPGTVRYGTILDAGANAWIPGHGAASLLTSLGPGANKLYWVMPPLF
jgi:hypothetical protein